MDTARDELRSFAQHRSQLALELVAALAASLALLCATPRVELATREVQVYYFLACVMAAFAVSRLVPRLYRVAAFRCPRCGQAFHGLRHLAERGVAGLRCCANCSLTAESERALAAPERRSAAD